MALFLSAAATYLIYNCTKVEADAQESIIDNPQNYQKLLSLIENNAAANLVKETKNQDIIIFLGKTSVGKGVVVNQLLGNKLKAFENQNTQDFK